MPMRLLLTRVPSQKRKCQKSLPTSIEQVEIMMFCHMQYVISCFIPLSGPHALPDARQPRAPCHDGGHPRAVRPRPHDQEDAHQVLQHQQQQARLGQVRYYWQLL